MRIAVIVRSLKFGGMERAACNQADAFVQSGHNVDLIYFSEKNKAIKPRENKVNIIYMDINGIMKKNPLGFTWNIFSKIMNAFFRGTYPIFKGIFTSNIFKKELNKLENSDPYDLILVRGQGSFEQIWKVKDDRIIKITVNVSTNEKSTLKDKIISQSYFNDVNVNCNSEGGAKYFERKFKRENVNPKSLKAIRNPFFKEKVIELAAEKNENIPTEPYILGVGRLVKAKNFDLLLDTYIYLKKNYAFKYKLVLVGEGSEKEFLERKVFENNLKNDVVFAGYQKNPYNWMKNSEAFILTSKFEGLCGVLIEAMCCKTRVIASESPGGVKELMSGSKIKKFLVRPDEKELSNALLRSLKESKEYFYLDYEHILSTLEPSFVVERWLEYVNKDKK